MQPASCVTGNGQGVRSKQPCHTCCPKAGAAWLCPKAPKPELLKAALEAGPPKGLAALAPPKLKLGELDAPKLKAEELCPKGELACIAVRQWSAVGRHKAL